MLAPLGDDGARMPRPLAQGTEPLRVRSNPGMSPSQGIPFKGMGRVVIASGGSRSGGLPTLLTFHKPLGLNEQTFVAATRA